MAAGGAGKGADGALAYIIWTTVPDDATAQKIAGALVRERLAACVHQLPAGRSVYVWQGQVEREEERLLMIKTRPDFFPRVSARLRDLHPYEVPEILAAPVVEGSPDYLDWMNDVIKGEV